jgi:hypothetical protein
VWCQPHCPNETVDRALTELGADLADAIEVVCSSLPDDFPAEVRDAIAGGALQRLEIVSAARF